MSELEQSINASDADLVLIGTPIDLGKLLKINKPSMRVLYNLGAEATEMLKAEVQKVVS